MAEIEQAASPLQVGDTVRIVGAEYHGQIGELRVIDWQDENGYPYGVHLDSVDWVVPFHEDEIERVEE